MAAEEIPMCRAEHEHGLEPCIREPEHDGEHYFWSQVKWPGSRSTYGIVVYMGGRRAIANLEVDGEMTMEEIAAVVAVMEANSKRKKAERGSQ
jgi:hypothetical protein